MSLILDGTNGLSDVDGTAAAPAIRGTDANTGIFFPAADTIAFAEGGAEAMRIDSSGNVGIGTSSPSQKLEVAGNALLSNNQYLGIKDSTGAAVGFPIYTGSNDAIFGYLASGSTGISTYQFRTGNNTERMRIDSSGNLLVNTTSQNDSTQLSVTVASGKNGIGMSVPSTAETGNIIFRNPNGVVGRIFTNASATTYSTSSDYRLKEDIAPMTGALAKVALLKPCTYKWKVDGKAGQGFIAHELQAVVPDCVVGEKDAVAEEQYEVTPAVKDEEGRVITEAVMGTRTVPQYQGIDTSFLVATLTAAIQEQQTLIVSLQDTLTALTTRITALEGAAA